MKKTILLAAIFTYLFAGCSGNKTNEEHGHEHGPEMHEHHDGSGHHNDTVKQEEFTVDTTNAEAGHDHPHSHDGHEHKH